MEHKYLDKSWLYDQYIVKNRTIKSICGEFGVAHQSVERYLKKYGIKKFPVKEMPTAEDIRRFYVGCGYGVSKIAGMYPGVGVDTIRRIMRENNIDEARPGELMARWWEAKENRDAMSEKRLELWKNEEYRAKTSVHLKDKNSISNRAIKYSANYQGVPIEEWNGFLTPKQTRIRESSEYAKWRESVFLRDDYTCQCCGARSRPGCSVTLHAHHLESFAKNEQLRFDTENGITLCYNCHDIRAHGSFHNLYGSRNNTRKQFEEYMKKRTNKDSGGGTDVCKRC